MYNNDPRKKFPTPSKGEHVQVFPGIEENMAIKPEFGKDLYRGSGRLADKTALITGGDSGIGRAVALAFAKEGASILISYLPEEEQDAQVTVSAVQEVGGEVICSPGDLRDEAYCREVVALAGKHFGAIDILVNNAALQKYFESFEEITAQDFQDIYKVNVVAPFLLTQAALAYMQPGSSIINTVSREEYEPSSLLIPCTSSKGALVTLTKSLAGELISKGIRVNAVAPGPVWTPWNTYGAPPEKLMKFGEKSLFGRPAQPMELAPVYVLLASDEASYITGEVYGVTGRQGVV